MLAVETDSLYKSFGSVQAVEDVTLRVEQGEVFGFLGPNGAGKSTVINVLLDFVRRSSGSVRVLGHDPEAEARAVRRRVGILPEATGFYSQDTARDHLRFAVDLAGTDDDIDRLLERVGIASDADRRVREYSKGMRKRLGLAIALVGEPELLVLDEPLGGLDPAGAQILRDVVRAESERGTAVFFSSHIMSQVEAVCDRVGIMNDGRLIESSSVDEIRSVGDTELSFTLATSAEEYATEVDSVGGVTQVVADGDVLSVSCTDEEPKVEVISKLVQSSDTVRDVQARSRSLEEVFRQMTESER